MPPKYLWSNEIDFFFFLRKVIADFTIKLVFIYFLKCYRLNGFYHPFIFSHIILYEGYTVKKLSKYDYIVKKIYCQIINLNKKLLIKHKV